MDDATAWLVALGIVCVTGMVCYVVAASNHRARLQKGNEERRDHSLRYAVLVMQEMAERNGELAGDVIDKLLVALTEPLNAPAPPQIPVHEQEVAGQAQDAIREFHDGFGGDPVDTPDWTDGWMPDRRGDEPRVASVRPGDTIIPGQGNWEQMMGEGRAVVGDEVVSGEEQWDGEQYDGGQ